MADVFPRVRVRDAVTDKEGRASPMFVQFWDRFCRGLESVFRKQAATDARQDAADARQDAFDVEIAGVLDTIVGILNGTIAFSELNVASTQYRAFLQKTDGTKLTDSTGLDTGVVPTGAVALVAITNQVTSVTSAQINLAPSAVFLQTIQSVTITPTGGRVVLDGLFYIRALVGGGSFSMTTVIERLIGGILTTIYTETVDSAPLTGADQIVGKVPVKWTDTPPGGGPVQYDIRLQFSVSGWSTLYASQRFMSAQEFKR